MCQGLRVRVWRSMHGTAAVGTDQANKLAMAFDPNVSYHELKIGTNPENIVK